MGPNTVAIAGLEFHFAGESVTRSGLAGFIVREYVAWDDNGPIDRFQLFRTGPDQPWTAWRADTFNVRKRELRGVLAEHLNVHGSDLVRVPGSGPRSRTRRQRPPVAHSKQ